MRNIYTKMLYTSYFFGKKFIGNGIYQEKKHDIPSGIYSSKNQNEMISFRYEITHQLEDRDIRQVFLLDAEGKKFWRNQNIFLKDPPKGNHTSPTPRYISLNLEKIHQTYLFSPTENSDLSPPWYGMMSLERILENIQKNFRFYSHTATEISSQQTVIPVYHLKGEWKKEILHDILTLRHKKSVTLNSFSDFLKNVPEEIPSTISIYFGQKDFFPYQIEFYRPDAEGNEVILFQLKFNEVNFNVKFQANEFKFQLPPHALEEDETDFFLQKRAAKMENSHDF
ncbi:MAG: hypothetical protein Q4C96_04815 [Planctomycetia bacterium]|nr:hypothetical protein [Planctomycetia bacterium]